MRLSHNTLVADDGSSPSSEEEEEEEEEEVAEESSEDEGYKPSAGKKPRVGSVRIRNHPA